MSFEKQEIENVLNTVFIKDISKMILDKIPLQLFEKVLTLNEGDIIKISEYFENNYSLMRVDRVFKTTYKLRQLKTLYGKCLDDTHIYNLKNLNMSGHTRSIKKCKKNLLYYDKLRNIPEIMENENLIIKWN